MAHKKEHDEDMDPDMPAMGPDDSTQGEKGGRADEQGSSDESGRGKTDEDTVYNDEDIM